MKCKTLYGGEGKPHHIFCNYSNARINVPCSQCDRLYRADEFTPEEQLARFAANALKLADPNADITYGHVRDFMLEHGYATRQFKIYHGEADKNGVDCVVFHNPSYNFFLALPIMAENDILGRAHVESFRNTVLKNDPQ